VRRPLRIPAALLIAWSCPAVAAAQSAATTSVAIQQYQPTPFSDRMLRLDGSGVAPFGELRIGLDVDYAFKPLVLVDQTPAIFQAGAPGPNHDLIKHAVGGTVLASFGLGHRLELGLAVPLLLYQHGEDVTGAAKPTMTALSNPLVGLKVHFGSWRGLGAGATVTAALPVGTGDVTHDTGFGGTARLFADFRRGPLTFGVRGGYHLHGERTFYNVELGNQLDYAAGASLRLGMRTTLMAEGAGLTSAKNPFKTPEQSPLEALGGLRQRIGHVYLTLAGGPGLVRGYGSPVFRAVAGLTWSNRVPDADGDGVDDDNDLCPTVPEDRDGFEDGDGCPDPDNDKDGILDAQDRCPNDPEDKDGFEDSDGCPDLDNDQDGIPDAQDKCPNEPETKNGFQDEDGCPDETPASADKDGDGIPDDEDECPEEAEDKDGFEDGDGCPDLDNDRDGIPDAQDKCPLEPETINGIADDDGCPDSGPTQVRLGKNEIETLQPIFFDTDRSRVRHAFYNVLGQVALMLKAHPEIGRCAVEGHTDDTGPEVWNQKLSILRAESVIEFLANKGVDPKRLMPIGHGEKLPWASNETPWGRARNRRVVFHIEGVDSADEKKAEEREERRVRIRRKREAAQDAQEAKEARPDKADKKSTPPASEPKAPKTPAVPPEGTKPPPAKGAPQGEVRQEGGVPQPGNTKSGNTNPGNTTPGQSGASKSGDNKSGASKSGDNKSETTAKAAGSGDGKSAPEKPADQAATKPASSRPSAGERPKLPAKVAEPPADSGDEDEPAPKAAGAKNGGRVKTPRTPHRPAEDVDPERPQSLQELLKLPPR